MKALLSSIKCQWRFVKKPLHIVTMPNENEKFGDDQDVDEDDGGFVLVIESKEDLADFSVKCDVPTSMK